MFFYPDDSEILETWNQNSIFKYFWVVRIEKQIRSYVFWVSPQEIRKQKSAKEDVVNLVVIFPTANWPNPQFRNSLAE
jgi:hypothetical protein